MGVGRAAHHAWPEQNSAVEQAVSRSPSTDGAMDADWAAADQGADRDRAAGAIPRAHDSMPAT